MGQEIYFSSAATADQTLKFGYNPFCQLSTCVLVRPYNIRLATLKPAHSRNLSVGIAQNLKALDCHNKARSRQLSL